MAEFYDLLDELATRSWDLSAHPYLYVVSLMWGILAPADVRHLAGASGLGFARMRRSELREADI